MAQGPYSCLCFQNQTQPNQKLSPFIRVTLIPIFSRWLWSSNSVRPFISNRRTTRPGCKPWAVLWIQELTLFFFFLISKSWIIVLSTIGIGINEHLTGIHSMEENPVNTRHIQELRSKTEIHSHYHVFIITKKSCLVFALPPQEAPSLSAARTLHKQRSGHCTLLTAPVHGYRAPSSAMPTGGASKTHLAPNLVSTLFSYWPSRVPPWWQCSLSKSFPHSSLLHPPTGCSLSHPLLLPDYGTAHLHTNFPLWCP